MKIDIFESRTSNQRNHDIRIVNVNGNIVLCWFNSILEIG